MKFKLPVRAAQTGELRLRFRRIPEQSCVVHVYAGAGASRKLLASAPVYGRGEGSAATEQVVLPLRFAPGSAAAGEELAVEVTGVAGMSLRASDLELLEAT